jgi:histidine triad (HIT) family protein
MSNAMSGCPFCWIAAEVGSGSAAAEVAVVHAEAEVIAFLDSSPIRPGHTQIIPRAHVETFEHLPSAVANRMFALGRQLARRMKEVYRVQRVAFLFTGGDIPHAHAHVVPIHDSLDITSARYLLDGASVRWSSDHLRMSFAERCQVRDALGFRAT